MGRLYFKFKKGISIKKQRVTISALQDSGLEKIERLFPEATDDVRSLMYMAVAPNAKDEINQLKSLQGLSQIEFAEREKKKGHL